MSIIQRPRTARAAAAYRLRLHGGTEDERLIDLPPGKTSVGSGPRCQIRLEGPGIGAMECLLVCDRSGLRVRRWSDHTRLNGQAFEDATLAVGDVLAVGPLELTIVARSEDDLAADLGSAAESWAENRLQSACDAIDDIFQADEGRADDHDRDDRRSRPTQRISRPATPAAPAAASPATANDAVTKRAVRRRSRRALGVIRRQRRDHDELLARVGDLEKLLAQALAESADARPAVAAAPAAEPAAESVLREQLAALEGELGTLQQTLGSREAELQQARYAIDALERQLIDSQHTLNAFAEERVHWEHQFNEIESRLARYVERIQELEEQLAEGESRAVVTTTAASVAEGDAGIDWAAELGPAEEASTGLAPAAIGPEMIGPETVEATVEPSPDDCVGVATAVEEESLELPLGDNAWQETVAEVGTETSEADVETAVAPPTETGAESIDVSENGVTDDGVPGHGDATAPADAAADEAAEPPTSETNDLEVEQALEHLRGISIWRESSAPGPDARNSPRAEESPAPAENRAASGPVSFLDRYAHMFAEEDAAAPAPRREDSTTTLREAVPPPEVHTDEESVEQYMAKLLERMRGGPAGGGTSSNVAEPPKAVEAKPAPSIPAAVASVEEQPQFPHREEMKTKASAPELPSDMAAMRALANQSARHALSLHAARKLRRTAITRVIVTALAASVAVYLLLNASTWRSLAFAAGCAAAFASLYWGMLTMGTLLKGFQLGAFDDYEEELASEKSLHPPLPIDVEQTGKAAGEQDEEHPSSESASDEPASEAAAAR